MANGNIKVAIFFAVHIAVNPVPLEVMTQYSVCFQRLLQDTVDSVLLVILYASSAGQMRLNIVLREIT
jgi:hypothetical protein